MWSIRIVFWGALAVLTGLWLVVDSSVFEVTSAIALRGFMVQYSGILAMGCMSLAMVLATRPRWPEPWLGGLDKMYRRLHKWLGIGGLVLAHRALALGGAGIQAGDRASAGRHAMPERQATLWPWRALVEQTLPNRR